jgi:hypothetical protein
MPVKKTTRSKKPKAPEENTEGEVQDSADMQDDPGTTDAQESK